MDRCKKCGSIFIENRTHMLCSECNFIRRKGVSRSEYKRPKKTNKPKRENKRENVLQKDKETYRVVFETRPNRCEECGVELPDIFELDGEIVMIGQYSHIISKGSHPEFRNDPLNFNRLCLRCHDEWEFGDREKMSIFESNKGKIKHLFDEKLSKSSS